MDRLSALDASFLHAETEAAHMHVGWLAMVRAPDGRDGIDPELLRARLEARLELVPRFRRRVVSLPIGEPALVDDPSFSVGRHLRVVEEADEPLSPRELQRLLDRFLSTQLDRARPLWEIAVVPRVQGGRSAILGKVHHALVDGVAAVELGALLFDLEPDTGPAEAPEWKPALPPSPVGLLVRSATDSALDQFRAARRVANLGLRPQAGLRSADSMRRAAFAMAREIAEPAPRSYLNGPIGPRRTLRTTSLPLERVLELKRRTDSKLNDVVLALVSGALNRFSSERGESQMPLRAMIPINVRGGEDNQAEGNRITFGFVELPISTEDPLTQLRQVRRGTASLRAAERAAGSDLLMQGIGLLPGPIKSVATRVASSSRTFNLTVSNVPGPRVPLYVAAGEVESIYPVIPLAGSHALAIGVLTYGSGLHVALHAEPDQLPGAAELPGLFELALQRLERAQRAAGECSQARPARGLTPKKPTRPAARRRPAPSGS